jgi:hypothetical protein
MFAKEAPEIAVEVAQKQGWVSDWNEKSRQY